MFSDLAPVKRPALLHTEIMRAHVLLGLFACVVVLVLVFHDGFGVKARPLFAG